jgi:hypothetical protein
VRIPTKGLDDHNALWHSISFGLVHELTEVCLWERDRLLLDQKHAAGKKAELAWRAYLGRKKGWIRYPERFREDGVIVTATALPPVRTTADYFVFQAILDELEREGSVEPEQKAEIMSGKLWELWAHRTSDFTYGAIIAEGRVASLERSLQGSRLHGGKRDVMTGNVRSMDGGGFSGLDKERSKRPHTPNAGWAF